MTHTKDEALKLALRSLKELVPDDSDCAPALQGQRKRQEKAITACQQALAVPTVQEPDPCPGCRKGVVCKTPSCERLKLPADHPYRTTPPAAPVPLRDEQIEKAATKLAECMDYPWAQMPEQGKLEMRNHAKAVIEASGITKGQP